MFSLLLIICVSIRVESIWIDKYNTIWNSPGVGQWQNLPIGNGDLVANVWLSASNNLNIAPNQLSVTPCLTLNSNKKFDTIANYSADISNQTWTYDSTTKLLKNQAQCVVATGNSNPVQTDACDASNANQQWTYNSNKEFVSVSKNTCLDIFGGGSGVKPIDEYHCSAATNQEWTIDTTTNQIKSVRFPTECLTATPSGTPNGSTYDLWFAFGKSDTYDLTGERLKMIQLKVAFNPPITNDNSFKESLFLSNATVIIQDNNYFIKAYIDRNDNTLNVQSVTVNDKQYSITASIHSWRTAPNFNPGKETGQSFCGGRDSQDVPLMNEVLLNNGCSGSSNEAAQTIFYHRNNYKNNGLSEWDYNLKLQSMASVSSKFKDPYYNVTWGAVLYLSNGKRTTTGTVSVDNVKSATLTFQALTKQTISLDEWVNELCSKSENYMNQNIETREKLHNVQWNDFWNRSQVDITNENNSTLFLVSELYNEQRYLDALDGYSVSNHSIKFNGQSFWIDTGNGPDYKQWASGYWWQNTRQPYYNTLIAGDNDMNVAFYNHYINQIPLLKERNLIWLNHSGGFFGETAMITGLFQEGTFGYACGKNPSPLLNVIRWLRYHWVGGLELVNMLLDDYIFYQNGTIINHYTIPIINAVFTHYLQYYKINETTNKLYMYPAQSLETWQCPNNPVNYTNCAVNPTEQVAGLQTVSKRLLSLPANFGTSDDRKLWQKISDFTPEIHLHNGIIWPAEHIPSKHSNSENTELYTIHPFKMYSFLSNSSDLELAINTYKKRRFPCNINWCQDIMDAAILGLTTDAKNMLVGRAKNGKGPCPWKWWGFYCKQSGDNNIPNDNHIEWMRSAVHYMLIGYDINNINKNNKIYLLPSWPCEWSVDFKFH
eukprot:494450_1